jgi:hypothetical protein
LTAKRVVLGLPIKSFQKTGMSAFTSDIGVGAISI